MLIVGVVLVLVVAAVVLYNWHLFNQIHTVAVKGLSAQGSGAELGTENVLMVGSTDRCDLPKSDPLYQDCLQGHTGINRDVVMILHLVPATKQVSVLSIPRDTFVPNARAEGANKIKLMRPWPRVRANWWPPSRTISASRFSTTSS